MTNREAIENLKGCVVSYEVDEHGNPNGNVTADLTMETINMAISALEKQTVDKCCETCKHKRHTAIEWPCRECYMSLCDIEDYYEPYTEEEA